MTDARAATRREPWPWAVGLALAAMIGVCVAFFAIARSYPDPALDLPRAGQRPYEGYVAPEAR